MNNRLLPEICKIQYGFAFDSAKFSSVSGTPLVRIRDVVRGFSETYTTEECSDEYLVQNGDILIGMDGEFNISRWNGGRAYLNQRVCRLIPTSEVDPVYLFYFMPKALKDIEDKTPFVTVKHLSAKELNRIVVPIPTVTEQQKISTVLQSLDNLITLRKQQLSKLDELVKSRFIELFGDPETNPKGWKCITVQQAINEKIIDKPLDGNHGGKHPKVSDYVPAGVPFIMANNLVDGRVDLKNCAFITQKQADSLDKGFAKDGDVLITHKGTIGRTDILHCVYPYIMLTPQVTYYRPITGIVPEYLKAYFDTDYFQRVIGNIASVGSTRAYIGITAQQELPLLIPSMEKQQEYVAFVEQTDKSKLAVQQSLEKLETLKKALMQKYFG